MINNILILLMISSTFISCLPIKSEKNFFGHIKSLKHLFSNIAPAENTFLPAKKSIDWGVGRDKINFKHKPILKCHNKYLTSDALNNFKEVIPSTKVFMSDNDWNGYRKKHKMKVHFVKANFTNAITNGVKDNGMFKDYKLIAHRGGITGEEYDEFTPESINQAIKKGYYGLEIDVRMTKDSVLIAHHDPDFKRFFNDNRRVEEMTWEEVKSLKTEKGGYQTLSFEDVAKLYTDKVRFMIDMKVSTPVAFEKLKVIMNRYNLLNGETYFLGRLPREYFQGKAKFTFSINEIPEMMEKMKKGENVARNFYLFGSGTNRMTSSAVKWCQQNSITVIVAINKHNYVYENHWQGAKRDIEYWKKCGVKIFQVDSYYDKWFIGNN